MLIPAGKRSGFYTIVPITIWSANYCALFLEYVPETYLAGLGASRM
jgi:hypothetical protein